MAYNSLIIQVFISSPSDVAEDREFVRAAMDAWNQRNAKERGCFLTPLTWENIVSPDMGESSQEVINVEIGDDYDVFLGLMWSRFGTPTSHANSGTEEEFERAVRRKNEGDGLRISFLFKNADVPIDKIDPEQIQKIKDFKNSAGKDGLFYRQYANQAELITSLNIIFDKIAKEKDRYSRGGEDRSGPLVLAEPQGDKHLPVIEEQDGFFDHEEKLAKASASLGQSLGEWGSRFQTVNNIVIKSTENLAAISQFGNPDTNAVRSAVNDVTNGLMQFHDFIEDEIEKIEDDLEILMTSIAGLHEISNDFDEKIKGDLVNQVSSLKSTIVNTSMQVSGYIDSLSSIPRIDARFVKARNSVIAVHKRFLKKLEDFHARLDALD